LKESFAAMSRRTIAFLDCPSGLSGDMLLGALLDAGLDLETLRVGLRGLDLDGYTLTTADVMRGALGATQARVVLDSGDEAVHDLQDLAHAYAQHSERAHPQGHDHEHAQGGDRRSARAARGNHEGDDAYPHDEDGGDQRDAAEGDDVHPHDHAHEAAAEPWRTLPHILALIARSSLPPGVKEKASAVFLRLAVAEARVHRVPVGSVHFHEVGAVDAIVDIVGVCLGLHLLAVDDLYCSPLPLARGVVSTAHGTLPLPAPATLEILAGVGAPTIPHAARKELVTPTGAALVAELAVFAQPAMSVVKVGYGAGTRLDPAPNLLRLWLGHGVEDIALSSHQAAEIPYAVRPLVEDMQVETLVVLETSIDDMPAELLAHALEKLLTAGALDAWWTGMTMKKGRPGTLLSALCRPAHQASLIDIIMRETATLGLRARPVMRYAAARQGRAVETPYGRVGVVLKLLDGVVAGASPEYEDCRRRATQAGVGLPLVYAAATAAAAPLLGRLLEGAGAEDRGDGGAPAGMPEVSSATRRPAGAEDQDEEDDGLGRSDDAGRGRGVERGGAM